MGMVDQVLRPAEPAPLSGRLAEVERILDEARDPSGLSEAEAVARIAQIVGAAQDRGDIYQKPLG
jgi:hypothetical protein